VNPFYTNGRHTQAQLLTRQGQERRGQPRLLPAPGHVAAASSSATAGSRAGRRTVRVDLDKDSLTVVDPDGIPADGFQMKTPFRRALFHSAPIVLLGAAISAVRLEVATGDNARALAGLVMIAACFMILVQASVLGRMRYGGRR